MRERLCRTNRQATTLVTTARRENPLNIAKVLTVLRIRDIKHSNHKRWSGGTGIRFYIIVQFANYGAGVKIILPSNFVSRNGRDRPATQSTS